MALRCDFFFYHSFNRERTSPKETNSVILVDSTEGINPRFVFVSIQTAGSLRRLVVGTVRLMIRVQKDTELKTKLLSSLLVLFSKLLRAKQSASAKRPG